MELQDCGRRYKTSRVHLFFLHSRNAQLQMLVHFLGGAVADAAVAWEYPFELAGEQFFHGARLLGPRIPADIAEGRQGFAFG